jgi:predicted ATPase
MKMLRLDIKGFRSLKDISWAPGDLNVVIGPNGTGKSNLLRILELISVSAQGRLGKYVQNSGGMEPLVWDGLSDGISFSIKASPVEEDRNIERDSLTYQVEMARRLCCQSF